MTPQELYEAAMRRQQAGNLGEAERLYRQVLAAEPDQPDALHMLGILAHQVGRDDAAMALIERAIAVRPGFVEAMNNLGNILTEMGQFGRAVEVLRRAVAAGPGVAECHNNLGSALKDVGDLTGAVEAYRRAISVRPEYSDAYCNLGATLLKLGAPYEAIEACRQAVRFQPASAEAHCGLANGLREVGQAGEAIGEFDRALQIDREYSVARNNRLLALHGMPGITPERLAREHGRWGSAGPFAHKNDRDPDRKLRVGYVSADFRHHSVAFFALPLLREHDRGAIGVTGYSTSKMADGVTREFQACCESWVDLTGVSDEAAAKKIGEDRIDILVDLSGFTAGNRLGVFSRKPAPVQVTHLGYPNTSGLTTMDWRITDAKADPGGMDQYYSEKLLRLPRTAWCFYPLSGSPEIVEVGKRETVFGSFNNLSKINDRLLHVWRKILERAPGSKLVLKTRSVATEASRRELLRRLGGDVELLRPDQGIEAHLRSYERVDVALDSFPYAGTTTTCEALWMGVPVVTLCGQTHAGRVGVSLLESVGMKELIAGDEEEYVRIAVDLARNLPSRADVRQRMKESPLMDAKRFAAEVEAGYRMMWRRWVEGP